MVLIKNKKQARQFLFLGIFIGAIFLSLSSFPDPVFAAGENTGSSAAAVAGIRNGDDISEGEDNIIVWGIKWLLYALLLILVHLTQVAASIFAWATRPEYISGPTGLLNLDSVYTLWKFIRDFFNLFFIFLLLFAAFATVFQIEKFGWKKNFFKIILAAIVINFSFPLTRIIIDAGNVPMYFFADAIVSSASENGNALVSIPTALWATTDMGTILTSVNPNQDDTLIPLITTVIFTFIFMITLLTLAVLFVLRLLKLIVLLILSPVGLAASVVPGLAKYGKDWWSQLIQTVLFGPAAMLLIVIALRFSAEIKGSTFAQGLSATAPAATAQSQSSIIIYGLFFIPILLMWMAIQTGSKFGIQGSSLVMKKADVALAWGKRQAMRPVNATGRGIKRTGKAAVSPITTRWKGAKAGIKDRFKDTPVGAKYWKEREELVEARAKARAKGIFATGGMAKQLSKEEAKLRDKRAQEELKKMRDEGKTAQDALEELKDLKNYERDGVTPKAKSLAAANFLANEKEAIKETGDLARALKLAAKAKKKDLFEKILQNADDDALELAPTQMQEVRESYELAFGHPFVPAFQSNFKKKGKTKFLIDHEIDQNRRSGLTIPPEDVYQKYMDKMKAKEIAQMDGIYDRATGALDPQVVNYLTPRWSGLSPKDRQDAFAELNTGEKQAWRTAGLNPQ